MRLEPDDRNITAVHPRPDGASGDLSCQRCGREFPSEEAWSVDYRHDDGDTSSHVVCPECALYLMPVRVTIDLDRLRTQATDPDLAPVVELVERVIDLRADPPQREIRLRATDVAELGREYDEHPVAVIQRLRDTRIAVSL
ncbi:MAG: hypothetical protein R3320_14520 [Nitriliruptorales bacterium]|nr:hypothetical protein [Nitriliruptorales bacterium]